MATMVSEATFTNVNAATVNLLTAGTAFRNMEWSYEMAGSEFPKQQDSGEQEAHVFVRKLSIIVNGVITASSYSSYWTNRQAIIGAFLVDRGAQTSYKHGRLTITPNGGSQVYADVVVDSDTFELPHDAGTSSTYSVTLRCPYGYWRKVSDDTVVKM